MGSVGNFLSGPPAGSADSGFVARARSQRQSALRLFEQGALQPFVATNRVSQETLQLREGSTLAALVAPQSTVIVNDNSSNISGPGGSDGSRHIPAGQLGYIS